MNTVASIGASLLTDIRYALRGLRNAPGHAATIVLTLALGLGAVTTMLAIVDSVLLRPIALPHPEQLMMISIRGGSNGTEYALSYKRIEELRRDAHSFTAIGGYNTMLRPVAAPEGSRMALLTEVTPQFFKMLGVHAKLGQLLDSGSEKAPDAVVSAAFWRERLHKNPNVIGSTLKVSGRLRTVIGVLPEKIHFPQGTEAPVVYTSVSLNEKGEDELFADRALVLARLKPGVSKQQALAEVRSLFAHSKEQPAGPHEVVDMQPYERYLTGSLQTALLTLLGGVGILMLIACANAANLQIARATERIAEMHVRSALGASFGRLMQQAVVETIVLSLLGATLGGVLAITLVAGIRSTYGQQFSRFDELAVYPAAFASGLLLALLTGVLASLAPVFLIRQQTNPEMTTARVTRRSRLQGSLVIVQIALTCVLLMVSGLFVRTFRALQDVRLGFDPRGVTTLVLTPEDQHKSPESSRQIDTRLLERFRTLPGIESATMQTAIPFSGYNFALNGETEIVGRAFQEGDNAFYSMVSSDFVQSSRMHLLRGRPFSPQDDASADMVAVVNEAFVNKFLAGSDPLRARVKCHRRPGDKDADLPFTQGLTVVGVVENELQGQDLGAPYQPMVYLNYLQLPKDSVLGAVFSMAATFAVRSSLPKEVLANQLRTAIKQVAPDMTEINLRPMEEGIAQSLGERRLALRLVTGFSGVAVVLAAIAIYGLLAYSVTQRRKEIGIRMALGSSPAGVTGLVIRQAAVIVACGLLLGASAAWPVGRAVKSFLFGVQALDTWTMAAATAVMLLVGLIAATVPAWRAVQVDPMEALRTD